MENYPGGTGKLAVAMIVVVLIAAAGFSFALTSGIISFNPIGDTWPTNVTGPPTSIPTTTITDPGPIEDANLPLSIVGDAEMIAAAAEFGFPGSGSGADPYIIENLSIVSDVNCIFIMNVEASFIIRNCNLSFTPLAPKGVCIFIGECLGASVINCRIEGGIAGIELLESDGCYIYECDIRYSMCGVNLSLAHETRIEANYIANVTLGMAIVGSDLTEVLYNDIRYCELGVHAQFSSRCMVDENTISLATYGIDIEGNSQNWTLYGNDIRYCSEIGIRLDETTSEMILYSNRLGWNQVSNAWDDGTDNSWDYESEYGNYWSDYVGTGMYTVPGSAGSIDHYPQLFGD
ncbi:MAG: NosD domain-containing protein [Candidatus Thorarchaeota archaeon]